MLYPLKEEGYNIAAISGAFGAYSWYSQPLADMIATAGDTGIIFCASAGNESNNNDGPYKYYPASFELPNIISVASTDHNDQLTW